MEKRNNIINFKERKDEKEVYGEENIVDDLISHYEKMKISKYVEVRVEETCRQIQDSSAEKNGGKDI